MATEAQQRARATWAAGDFDAIAERIWGVGEDLVSRVGVNKGDRVLDVACGTGNAAIPAAAAGGEVTGLDITPELFEDARRRAGDAGVELELVEGDAQDMPFEDQSFDVVVSTFGCMFAPDHKRAAGEIARVLKPGGRMGVAAWNPAGAIGQFFATIAKHAPPPPEGFQPPPLWGVRDHVTEIFEATTIEPSFTDTSVHWRFDSVAEMVDEYGTKFGPIVVLRSTLDQTGWEALESDLTAVFEELTYGEDDGVAFDGDYLITQGTKPG
ncbi:MAG TPA: methyltransferase domain-containing protein [Solirubrobacterales bacterium]|nr:methyltransferase domain-containing protein [Solirubrobacterales bacterium]